VKKTLLLALFCGLNIFASGHKKNDSLLRVLDQIVENRSKYDSHKQNRINAIVFEIRDATDDSQCYSLYGRLFDEYRNFRMDSALYVAQKRLAIAEKYHFTDSAYLARMNIAEALKGIGKYNEALDYLNNIPRDTYVLKNDYLFNLYHSIYFLQYKYAFTQDERRHYKKLLMQYKDTLIAVDPKNSIGYYLNLSGKFQMNGKHEQALSILKESCKRLNILPSDNAVLAFELANIYHLKGDVNTEEYYLILSATKDLKNSSKKHLSLQQLAILLYRQGDVDRAFNYITCSMEDINFSNARCRVFETVEFLPIISAAYNNKTEKNNLISTAFLIFTSIISIFLIIAIIFIRKRNSKLSATQLLLDDMNDKLMTMNSNLNNLNIQLLESNRIKEEYIGQLFHICSDYIDMWEKYRKNLSRKISAGQISEVAKMINNKSIATDELTEFFNRFDMIFLDLFPNFVEAFNSLLQPDEQIIPKNEELLTPELRIYALVRLGINDSIKIASFLHYSTQTVYNYRLRVRNKAIVPKDEFVARVQALS